MPGFGEIRVLGICDIQEQGVSCWDIGGRRSEDLATQVTSSLNDKKQPFNANGLDIPFHFRRKNRVLLVEVPSNAYGSERDVRLQRISTPTTENMRDLRQFRSQNAPTMIQYLDMDADEKASTTSLSATFFSKEGHAIELHAAAGATGTTGKTTVTIESIKPNDGQTGPMFFGPSKSWNVQLKFSGEVPSSELDVQSEALDAGGNPISFVDGNSRPAKAPTGPNVFTRQQAPNIYPVFAFAQPQYQPESTRTQLSLIVDPKYVTTLRIKLSTPKTVEFKNLPLDPKG